MLTRFILLSLLPVISFADPAPFGLEINKTTLSEAKNKYQLTLIGKSNNTGDDIYEIDTKKINFDGLISAKASFTKEGILSLVTGKMQKNKFDFVFNGLNNKYKIISKNIPFVGNKEAQFEDGNTVIILDSPHMSFNMEYLYINKKLLESNIAWNDKHEENQKKQEENQL